MQLLTSKVLLAGLALITYSFTTTTNLDETKTATCDCKIYIPNAFSPNEDGSNDLFEVFIPAGCSYSEYDLRVFNKWGALVFRSNSATTHWDGTLKSGAKAPAGSYVYLLEVTNQEKEKALLNDVSPNL